MPQADGHFRVLPGEGETIPGPAGGRLTYKARAAATAGALTAFENTIAPGDGPPLHLHPAADESWYVLEGDLRFRLGDERSDAPAGSFVFVPRGTPHAFRNAGAGVARILVLFTPAAMEAFFDGIGALPGRADPETFAALGRRAGMEIVGPPLGPDD